MDTESKVVIFYITEPALHLARRLTRLYPDAQIKKFNTGRVRESWDTGRVLIFITACGIVVRAIAPLIKDKKKDPAVLVLDEKGDFVISLLSGHLGGANENTAKIATFLGARPVITTSTDLNGMTSLDVWAKKSNLTVDDWSLVPRAATRFINTGVLKVYADIPLDLPLDFTVVSAPSSADVLITNKNRLREASGVYLRPKNLFVGIGCNRGTSHEEMEEALRQTLRRHNLSFFSIASLATVDRKADEAGLISLSRAHGFPVRTFTPDELNSVKGLTRSQAAFNATGAQAVAEPAAILASADGRLIVPKQRAGSVTVAVAEGGVAGGAHQSGGPKGGLRGALHIVGTGPGGLEHLTPYARNAILASETIVGYHVYLDLIRDLIKEKDTISTGMTREIERCEAALKEALAGKRVCLVSGGDPGIYAMAGLIYELLEKNRSREAAELSVEVVPGVSALNACAARLGAPLMHDFAAISLSDRLTDWELIAERLEAAARSDFVLVLYNPKSKGRPDHIGRARGIILRHRRSDTPVGIVKDATRSTEEIVITNLKDMLNHTIDMHTTVIIGNSQSFVWNDRMVTRRGYGRVR
ncbi:MAG TPA: precorrin-3B C(17)-methyltransferase [Syntrophorhabdaceae bacterium]|nr:precorrin-3B C(17)-methyltransferase [Syntrophorhabdaceae bacterium]